MASSFMYRASCIIRFPPGSADRTAIDPFQSEEGVASRRTESAGRLNLPLGNDDVLQFFGFLPVVGFQGFVQGNGELGKGVCGSRDTSFDADVECRLQQTYRTGHAGKVGFTRVAA